MAEQMGLWHSENIPIVVKQAVCVLALCVLVTGGCASAQSGSGKSGEPREEVQALSGQAVDIGASTEEGAGQSDASRDELDDGSVPDVDLLVALMGEESAVKLIEGAQTDSRRLWIAAHPEAIDFEGDVVQTKLLTLAANEDEAVGFVRDFADRYPSDAAEGGSGSAIANDSKVPHLYQWDQRWGYTVYSSTAFGLTGCGPAAFAMAYQGVTGKDDLSPYDMGVLGRRVFIQPE